MRLESLQLAGFRSFAGPTEVTFHPGVTCVVGPGGCGKSNLLDAVDWSLGENSDDDVLFRGTDRRPPAKEASATLRFLHESGESITISRRMRDDDSEAAEPKVEEPGNLEPGITRAVLRSLVRLSFSLDEFARAAEQGEPHVLLFDTPELPDGYTPDGASAVSVLRGTPMTKRGEPLFWKMGARWPARADKSGHWVAWAVVHERWKLVANSDLSYTELYDIANDVAEANDLKSEKPGVAEGLLAQLKEWQATLPEKPTGKVFSKLRDGGKRWRETEGEEVIPPGRIRGVVVRAPRPPVLGQTRAAGAAALQPALSAVARVENELVARPTSPAGRRTRSHRRSGRAAARTTTRYPGLGRMSRLPPPGAHRAYQDETALIRT